MLWNNDKRKEMEKKGAKWMYKQLSVGKNIRLFLKRSGWSLD